MLAVTNNSLVCCALGGPFGGLFYFAHFHLDLLIAALPLCISSYRFEFWVPIESHWLGMHIMILSLNGALPLYNTVHAYVLHEPSKAQSTMLLTLLCACISIVLQAGLYHVYNMRRRLG